MWQYICRDRMSIGGSTLAETGGPQVEYICRDRISTCRHLQAQEIHR